MTVLMSAKDIFEHCYKQLNLVDDANELESRWASITTIIEDIAWDDILTLILCVTNPTNEVPSDFIEKIQDVFNSEDYPFNIKENQREFELLCLIILVCVCQNNDHFSGGTALAVSTALLGVLEEPEDSIISIKDFAEGNLCWVGETVRKRKTITQPFMKTLTKIDLDKAFAQEGDINDTVKHAGEATERVIKNLKIHLNNNFKQINSYMKAQDEELQVLWWIFGGVSKDCMCKFESIPEKIRPLVLANELAHLTVFIPGLPSARNLLLKAGVGDDLELSIPELINSCDNTWLDSIDIGRPYDPALFPIHSALYKKIETKKSDSAWIEFWASISGVDAKCSFSAIELSVQFYNECLLARFIEDDI